MGNKVFRGGTLHHDVCNTCSMVWDLRAAGLPRGLLRLQEGAGVFACAHKPDPAPNPRTTMVYQWDILLVSRRHSSVWRCVHGAILHHVLHLAAPVLLLVWFPDVGDRHSRRHVRRNIDHADILPTDQRGLQLDVAVVFCKWFVCRLRLHVLVPLLLHADADWPLRWCPPLLRVHVCDLVHVCPSHRLHWLQCHLPVCPLDLRFDQDRLMPAGRWPHGG
mmetsp:Transcript_164007/g.398595  ORF Transcript_164007/g.398595 Transcript_164007/m.398595 type:complete len:219 (-) Transcript_164007:69-725(-)